MGIISRFLVRAALVASCFTAASALAVGPEESSCVDDLAVACTTSNPEVLAFRKKQVETLYAELVYPKPLEVLKDEKAAAHLFEISGVKGRVTPVGKFTDFSGVVEYFYALAANVGGHVYEYKINQAMADADKVFINVQLAFCFSGKNCLNFTAAEKNRDTLTETGYFVFNKQNKIIYFDVIIPNLGAALDTKNEPLARAASIAGMCAFLTLGHINPLTNEQVKGGSCTGYFDNKSDFPKEFILAQENKPYLNCLAFMASIPYGSLDRANSNTVACRSVHMLLTPLRPDYHCPHVAYSGGGKCVDFPYGDYYTEMDESGEHDHH